MENGKQPIYPQTMRRTGSGESDLRPARPGELNQKEYLEQVAGLSKREHFAAMAMQGILASPIPAVINLNDPQKAEYAVIMADALLRQLSK